jgi:FkbM family methyltransferase
VIVPNKAVSDTVGKCSFFVTDWEQEWRSVPRGRFVRRGARAVSNGARSRRGHNAGFALRRISPPDLVKIDIEGGEYRALRGVEGLLR